MNPPLPRRLLVWLILQLILLTLGAFGVPLSARHPEPLANLSAPMMLAGQIGIAAMLFPWLMPTWRHAFVIICVAMPFLILAGWLTVVPMRRLLLSAAYLALWLTSLSSVSELTHKCAPPHTTAVRPRCSLAIVTLWTLGGAVLFYMRLEFMGPTSPLIFGPLVVGLKMLSGELSQIGLLLPIALLSGALFTHRLLRQ